MTNNATRIRRAEEALIAYAKFHPDHDDDTPYSELIPDLLPDLMHLCRLEDINFMQAIESATINYNEELAEDLAP